MRALLKGILTCLPGFCIFSFSYSQMIFDFENTEIDLWKVSEHTAWEISPDQPLNGMYSLHHARDSKVSDNDQISIFTGEFDFESQNTSWEFQIRYGYTPSSSNNWAVFLASSRDYSGMVHGSNTDAYILGVNFTGSDDMLKLWKMESGKLTELVTTELNWQEEITPEEVITLGVSRSIAGYWKVQAKKENNNGSYTIGTGSEQGFLKTHFFGIYYEYSSTQDLQLWIDDITIDAQFKTDIKSPGLISVFASDSNRICLLFDEPMDQPSVTNKQNFLINNSQPDSIIYVSPVKIEFVLKSVLNNKNEYTIRVLDITDLAGNKLNITHLFNYYKPLQFDVLITEIMSKPAPAFNLPECEYIELYNRSGYTLNLYNWKLIVGNSSIFFDALEIPSRGYLVLIDGNRTEDFTEYGQAQFINLPGLNNSGDEIVLEDSEENVIHFVRYSDTWYESRYKQEGGWSLEMVDTENPCQQKNNWKESESYLGGTPGFENSVHGSHPDFISPKIIRAVIENESILEISFSEGLSIESLLEKKNYSVDHGIENPISVTLVDDFQTTVQLEFNEIFQSNTVYQLILSETITDCSGNSVMDKTIDFAYPEVPENMDLIFNEIMFNPLENEPEYIELFNCSDKILDLNELYLAIPDETDQLTFLEKISDKKWNVFPKGYVLILKNKTQEINCDNCIAVEMENFPTLNNTEGKLQLLNNELKVVDYMYFNEDMHFALLQDFKGVSLERINSELATLDKASWHSSASDVGYGTPGYQNSQHQEMKEIKEEVTVFPEVFSPDLDGVDDVTQILYEFNDPGYKASLKIYDARGRLVQILASGELLGTSGVFTWDGKTYRNEIAPIGRYLIFMEVFNLKGEVKKFKKSCVLAKMLR